MTPAEIDALLLAAKAVDDRVVPDDARAAAWLGLIESDMPFEFARSVLMTHYKNDKTAIMPSDFNTAWSIERRALARIEETKQRLRELEENRDEEMSPETKAALDEFWRNRGGRPKKRTNKDGAETDDSDENGDGE